MKVEVTLFATLADYLPAAGHEGSAVVDLPDESTIVDLARLLGIPPEFSWIALVNGQEADPGRRLVADDVVTLFPPLAGGAV